ncbi:hypothetical protein JOL62DRAFT_618962, partial [Phyllosticta paracitricarpa]
WFLLGAVCGTGLGRQGRRRRIRRWLSSCFWCSRKPGQEVSLQAGRCMAPCLSTRYPLLVLSAPFLYLPSPGLLLDAAATTILKAYEYFLCGCCRVFRVKGGSSILPSKQCAMLNTYQRIIIIFVVVLRLGQLTDVTPLTFAPRFPLILQLFFLSSIFIAPKCSPPSRPVATRFWRRSARMAEPFRGKVDMHGREWKASSSTTFADLLSNFGLKKQSSAGVLALRRAPLPVSGWLAGSILEQYQHKTTTSACGTFQTANS